jgi:hypothetical protein
MKLGRWLAAQPMTVRKPTGRVARLAAVVLATVGLLVAIPPPAFAGSLQSIVCGGEKFGADWHTFPDGGYYYGYPCAPGIDWVQTPTSATSWYHFGQTDGGAHLFQAWIPVNIYANAKMDFDVYICGVWAQRSTIDEYAVNYNPPWVNLFTITGRTGCYIDIKARTGMVSSGYKMGLDAVRILT